MKKSSSKPKPKSKAKRKPSPAKTRLDPDHPNHDAILLRRARLEAQRAKRLESGGTLGQEWVSAGRKRAAKPKPKPRGKR